MISLPRRSVLAGLIFMTTLAVWIPNQVSLDRDRKAIVEAREQLRALREQTTAVENALDSAQQEFATQEADCIRAVIELAKAEKEFAKVDPDSRWSEPPATLPDWKPDSPYVWLSKEMISQLSLSSFNDSGGLDPEYAAILAIDPKTQTSLNAELRKLVADFRQLQAAKAERTEDHLAGIADQEGEKLTIRVQPLPEEGARFKAQFEAALMNAMGEQRAKLVMKTGEHWIDEEFSQYGTEPKIISVLRRPNDTYNLSIKSGGNWFNTGGIQFYLLREQIPANVRHLFQEFLEKKSPGMDTHASRD
jgi:hypothetical protein